MEENYKRPMGSFNNKRGFKTRFSVNASLFRSQRNTCRCSKITYFTARGKKIVRKKCNRTCPSSRHAQRFLFNIFPSPQEVGRSQTCHKSPPSQQVSQETAFQNGLAKQCTELSSARRLGHISRFERCLHASSNLFKPQTVPPVLHPRQSLPVYLPLLRTHNGAKGLHQSCSRGSGTSEDAELASSRLFRRLVFSKPNQGNVDYGQKESTQSPSGTRFHDKFRKIGSRAKPVSCLHRGTFFVSKRPGLPNSGKNRKDKGSMQGAEKMSNSSKLPSFARTDGILHRTSSQCKIVHETNTVAPVTFLETVNNGPTDGSSIQQKCTATSKILAKQRQLVEREKFLCAKQLKNSDDRCIQVRVRRSLTESNLPGNLVYARGKKAHQLARTKGSISDHQTFSATSERSHSVDSIRQHNSCSVLEQGRGNSVTPVVLSDMGHMASSKSQQHCSEISPLGWSSECFGRQFEQSKNKTNRVVFEQCSSPQIVSDLGDTSDRSFRFRSKQENTSVLHMVSQSTGSSNRCIVNGMGKHGSICFSPNLSHSKSATAHEEIPMSDNTHSPTMAKETLVYQSPSNVNSMSKEVTTQTRSSVSTEDQNLSPKTRDIQSDCMAIVNQSFQNKGFSDDTRKLMVASWRSGTRRDYSVKFKKFNSWCTERKIDPHAATLTNCADFLSSLFQVGLKYRTISGYRSMLSVMLPQINGYPVGQHPNIIRLLKGVFNSRPPVKQLVPEWDLKKILELLSNPPFEPMNKISLKCLTWKTIFLTAISTFRRCSDLQALRCDAGFMNILPEGVIFIREGLSKQDRPSHNCKKIFVPCFKKNRKLDPKRAVEIYVKRTSEFRSSSEMEMIRQLFLTINKPHKAASRQTIASWIVSLIKLAYSDSESEINVRAHSTRAIGPSWALFKGASLSDILDAADWSSDATFKSYYYREMDAPSWEL